jgi:hypothetical protein
VTDPFTCIKKTPDTLPADKTPRFLMVLPMRRRPRRHAMIEYYDHLVGIPGFGSPYLFKLLYDERSVIVTHYPIGLYGNDVTWPNVSTDEP